MTCARPSWRLRVGLGVLFAFLAATCLSPPASAETLEQALVDAYQLNPALNAERARLRATDEQVAIAKSGLRPNISGSADWSYNFQNSTGKSGGGLGGAGAAGANTLASGPGGLTNNGTTHPYGWGVQLSQPLFKGFQALNSIRQSKSTVQAGREALRSVEQDVLLQAATAYVDVVRDKATVRLRENNVSVLNEQLKETQDRFDVGEVTRTDVAQAQARLAEAKSILSAAQAQLNTSKGVYEQVIGHPPGDLATPPSIRHLLPTTRADAMTLGDGENPTILAAVYSEEAALYNVQQLMGTMLPDVELSATYDQRFGQSSAIASQETATVMGRVNVPFYQGGAPSAQVRQAKETVNQLKREVEDARLRVHSNVISQWGILVSSGPAIVSAQAAVSANKVALNGVVEEAKVGQRTTLDVLNAQLELLNSQILLVTALRDRVVAEYALYAAIGRMDAQSLGLATPYYDPIEHYDLVKNKWFGLRPPSPPVADN